MDYVVRWKNHSHAPLQEEARLTLHDAVDYAVAISKQRKIEVVVLERGSLILVVHPD